MTRGLRDRLRLTILTWRYAGHIRLAHHPLCDRFAANVWRVGSLRICAGCTCLATGFLSGIALGAWLTAAGPHPVALLAGWTAMAVAVLPLSWPMWYRRWPPMMRHALRFLAGVLLSGAPVLACSGWWMSGLAMLVGLLSVRAAFARNRTTVKAHACDGCPHLGPHICPGFTEHAEAWRRIDAAWAAENVPPGAVLTGNRSPQP